MQTHKLECLALSPLFDTILISEAEGISKPDRQIFHRALERLDANAAQSAFVGDHPEVDVAGAHAARKLDQYAARKVSHLRGGYSTLIDGR